MLLTSDYPKACWTSTRHSILSFISTPHTNYLNDFIIQIVKGKKTQIRQQAFKFCPTLWSK